MRYPRWMDLSWLFPVVPPAKPDTSWTEHPFYEDRLGRIQRADESPEAMDAARRRLVIVNAHRDTINERINRLRAAHQKWTHLAPEWRALTAEMEALRTKLGEQV